MRYNECMLYRLIDKLILIGLSVASLFLLIGSAVGGRSIFRTNEYTIACILLIVIVCLTTEVLRSQYVSMGLVICVGVISFFVPETTTALPACVYGLLSDKKMEELLRQYHEEKAAKNPDWSLASQRALWLKGILAIGACVVAVPTYLVILVIPSALLAVKTIYVHQRESLLTDKFDDVRYDAQKSLRLKEEISNNLDMQVRNATLAERNRIAREIHDNVGHMLTRAVVQLQAINVINQDEKTKPLLESVTGTVNEAMTNIRRSVHELHDDSIDLSIGIHEIASAIKDRFDVTVSTSIESPIPTNVKTAILGIVKEGVTNIAKHSNGKKAKIEVVENVTFWRILVSDDGKCKHLELSRPADFATLEGEHGIGLYNINSRAVSCGGRTSIQGGDDGFHITVTIPRKTEERK